MRQTLIANIIDTADTDAQYDKQAKRMMSMTEILAWVLQSCVDEFKEYDVQFIMKNCFVGKPIVSQIAVDPDMPDEPEQSAQSELSEQQEQPAVNQYVETMNSEDITIKEHKVLYDVRFRARVPKTKEVIELIIDIEVQKASDGFLYVSRRGVYYASRMISAQFGTEFLDDHYEKIKKVISIWICPSTANYRKDSIVGVRLKPETIYGDFEAKEQSVDLLRVIIIGLTDGESNNPIIRLLSVYLSADKTPEDKKAILEKEFNIKMTEEMEQEVRKMYTLSEALKERTAKLTDRAVRAEIASDLLKETKSIPFAIRMSKLPEDVVRGIATGLGITNDQ